MPSTDPGRLIRNNNSCRPVDLEDGVASAGQEACETGPVGTCALNSERVDLSHGTRPPFDLLIPVGGSGYVLLFKPDTAPTDGHLHVLFLMCVHSDVNLVGATAYN